jgi:hypothetical protein
MNLGEDDATYWQEVAESVFINLLKVHKREKFFVSDFEFFTIL